MPKKKVMVADDDPAIVDVMKILLESNDYDVLITQNPLEIDELVLQNPDIILLDIWMSGVSGNEVCKRIKANAFSKDIPVIMFSANRDTKEISMQCGADGFIAKPFEIEEVLKIIEKHTAAL